MSEKFGFFNAIKSGDTYDRVYDAADFANLFSLLIGSGVFVDPADQLMVSAASGRNVIVKAGSAFIDGYWYTLDEDKLVEISANALAYERIDVVCCTLDLSTRNISVNVRENVPDASARNTGTVHDLVLAAVRVPVGASSITSADITDYRPDDTRCGFVKGTVEQITTGNLFAQFELSFNDWFNDIKGKLSGDAATQLQQQIDDLEESVSSQPTIRHGTTAPDNSLGKDGDVYIQITEE